MKRWSHVLEMGFTLGSNRIVPQGLYLYSFYQNRYMCVFVSNKLLKTAFGFVWRKTEVGSTPFQNSLSCLLCLPKQHVWFILGQKRFSDGHGHIDIF